MCFGVSIPSLNFPTNPPLLDKQPKGHWRKTSSLTSLCAVQLRKKFSKEKPARAARPAKLGKASGPASGTTSGGGTVAPPVDTTWVGYSGYDNGNQCDNHGNHHDNHHGGYSGSYSGAFSGGYSGGHHGGHHGGGGYSGGGDSGGYSGGGDSGGGGGGGGGDSGGGGC
ncbi:hypothetical protein F5Y05DRAFT_160083 [Hypoxylon sp. FL0543]|nr:hypothetical protein F5Y05DRAFT_160083 [Hypoxylon sp. FL0543]